MPNLLTARLSSCLRWPLAANTHGTAFVAASLVAAAAELLDHRPRLPGPHQGGVRVDPERNPRTRRSVWPLALRFSVADVRECNSALSILTSCRRLRFPFSIMDSVYLHCNTVSTVCLVVGYCFPSSTYHIFRLQIVKSPREGD